MSNQENLTIVDDLTIEKQYAWIFQYTSERFLQTGDLSLAIAGNSPLFISKTSGQPSQYRTGLSIDQMIEEYEEENKIWSLSINSDSLSDSSRLKSVREICKLTIAQVSSLKLTGGLIARGAKQRLLQIQGQLSSVNIDTALSLTTE